MSWKRSNSIFNGAGCRASAKHRVCLRLCGGVCFALVLALWSATPAKAQTLGRSACVEGPHQPASHYFHGQIDEVAIFNTALSSNQVAAIYAAGSGGMCEP
jgi:hypothetical protein